MNWQHLLKHMSPARYWFLTEVKSEALFRKKLYRLQKLMARKFYFIIWIASTAAIGFLAFMPDYMGRAIYSYIFSNGFYIANADIIQMLAHGVFFFFNSLFFFLFLNTYPQAGEIGKFMAAFVWAALITLGSEAGQMYFLPQEYNRSGLNIRDTMADFSGFFAAWLFYLICVKLIYGLSRPKYDN